MTAIIRYNVPPEEGFGGNVLGNIALRLRYRDGNGRVLATLIEVAVPVAPGYIAETPLLRFDSEDPNFGGPSSNFRTHITQLELDSDQYQHQFDFDGNIYYIDLTLSGPEFVLHYPPAVAAIEIIGRQTV